MTQAAQSSTKKKATVIGTVAAAIIAGVFAVEGGYVDNKKDPGGKTNHGMTEAVARKNGWTGDMKDLPKEFAQSVYYEDYIVKPGFLPIIELSPAVAEEMVDSAVNTGPAQPSRWFQQTLNTLGYPVKVDGQIGPATIEAYKALQKRRGSKVACQITIKSLDGQQLQYYIQITQKNPKLQEFTAGWMINRIGNVPLSHCT